VELTGSTWGEGEGRTKKEAEQAAARTAVERLERGPGVDGDEGAAPTPAADVPEGDGTPEPAGTTRGGNHA
jgi:hypothetical protein